jgi:hypothetical protein
VSAHLSHLRGLHGRVAEYPRWYERRTQAPGPTRTLAVAPNAGGAIAPRDKARGHFPNHEQAEALACVIEHIRAAALMCCVRLCAVDRPRLAGSLLSAISDAETQHITDCLREVLACTLVCPIIRSVSSRDRRGGLGRQGVHSRYISRPNRGTAVCNDCCHVLPPAALMSSTPEGSCRGSRPAARAAPMNNSPAMPQELASQLAGPCASAGCCTSRPCGAGGERPGTARHSLAALTGTKQPAAAGSPSSQPAHHDPT